MQGAEECRLRRISNTPQGEATEGNSPEANKRSSLDPALRGDDSLMVDQGQCDALTFLFERSIESIPCYVLNVEKRDKYGFTHKKGKKGTRQEASA